NACSMSLQRSSAQYALLSSLQCPTQHVLALGDGPEDLGNDRNTGYLPSGPVFQVAYAHNKNLLVAVDEDGVVGIAETASGRRKSRWMAHHNAIFDGIWTQDDAQLLTAAGDLEIRIWDVETAGTSSATETKPVAKLKGHDMSVKCVRQAPNNAHVFASGGRDGRVLLWDSRATRKPVSSLENVHAEPSPSRSSSSNVSFTSPTRKKRRRGAATSSSFSPRSVTCVEFGDAGNEIITAGAVDAVVKIWDIRRLGTNSTSSREKKVAKVPVPIREISCSSREGARRGISSLMLQEGSGGASRLLVNVLNDSIALIDIGEKQHGIGHNARTILRCSGHQASSFYSKSTFSPEGNFVAGASADGVVYIWDVRVRSSSGTLLPAWSGVGGVQQRMPCYALKGHTNEVNGVAWNAQDFTQLSSCSDDGTIRCWQIGGERGQRLGNQNGESRKNAVDFELQFASTDDPSGVNSKMEWANWSAFVEQPDGYAYHVRSTTPALKTLSNHQLSPRRQRSSVAVKQRGSPQVTRHSTAPRLHPVHEIPTAQQQPQQEPQATQETQVHQKRRIKLRRKAKPSIQPKRAQRTLLELWGR
ncbi:hypothetical protein PHMEG_00028799, partial [Phytophthora megakarya]